MKRKKKRKERKKEERSYPRRGEERRPFNKINQITNPSHSSSENSSQRAQLSLTLKQVVPQNLISTIVSHGPRNIPHKCKTSSLVESPHSLRFKDLLPTVEGSIVLLGSPILSLDLISQEMRLVFPQYFFFKK